MHLLRCQNRPVSKHILLKYTPRYDAGYPRVCLLTHKACRLQLWLGSCRCTLPQYSAKIASKHQQPASFIISFLNGFLYGSQLFLRETSPCRCISSAGHERPIKVNRFLYHAQEWRSWGRPSQRQLHASPCFLFVFCLKQDPRNWVISYDNLEVMGLWPNTFDTYLPLWRTCNGKYRPFAW